MSEEKPTRQQHSELVRLTPSQEHQLMRWRRSSGDRRPSNSETPGFSWRWGLSVLAVWSVGLTLAAIAIVLLGNPRYSSNRRRDPEQLSIWTPIAIGVCCASGTFIFKCWLDSQTKE
ncbi:hypothetical protein [Baaleninema simplex]|uniref:hypothetical protein n=1 Tax=Baaleninema simplex TaxID=2862350 RepID=UPI000374F658|nr:hypothetical protein [Baaleninema simplex]